MRHASVLSAALFAAALAACGDSTGPANPPLAVTPNPSVVACTAGQAVPVGVTVTGGNGTGTATLSAVSQGAAATVATTGATTLSVTCVSAGATTITITASNGGQSATSTIPVNIAPPAPLVLALSPTSVSCLPGQTVPVGITVTGATGATPTLTFASSSGAATATAATGGATIRCVSAGATDFTVTATSGPQTGVGILRVTVAPATPITIVANPAQIACTAGSIVPVSIGLTGSQSGGGTLAYTSSDPRAVVIGTGSVITVRCVSPGSATITVTATDGAQSGTLNIPVTITTNQLAVSLSSTAITCVAGETRTLTANVSNAGTDTPLFVFSTTSPSIALTFTGNRATIQCGSTGTATVTATATTPTGSGSATATVAVSSPIAGLTLTPETAVSTPGATVNLTPVVTLRPGAPIGTLTNVRYTSSNPVIATVATNTSGGATVTILSNVASINQQVVITATALGDPTIQATSTIVIVDPTALVQSVTLATTAYSLAAGDTTRLVPTVTIAGTAPAGTSRAVTYSSSNQAVATVSADGLITARTAGTTTITVASVAAPSILATATVTVSGTTTNPGTGNLTVQLQGLYTFNSAGQAVVANPGSVSGNLLVSFQIDPGNRIVDAVNIELGTNTAVQPCLGAVTLVTGAPCTVPTAAVDGGARRYPNGTYPLNIVVLYRETATSVQQRFVTTVSTIVVNN